MDDYFKFLTDSPSAWHAVDTIEKRLKGFSRLEESEEWNCEAGKGYYFVRGGTIFAFRMPKSDIKKATILASHTDSPAPRLKPNPLYRKENMNFLRVGIFGGPIVSTWMDRDLCIAGIIVKDKGGKIVTELYHDKTPLNIPSLSLHLRNEKERKVMEIDRQKHFCPLYSLSDEEMPNPFADALGFDLFLVPLEEPRMLNSGLLAAYRHDNLSSAYAMLNAFQKGKATNNSLQVCAFFNHEEIGSLSDEGADSLFLDDFFTRLNIKHTKPQSYCVSIDVTHAYHPSFTDKYDPGHKLLLGHGPAIKYNSDLKSVTTAKTGAPIVKIARDHNIPLQMSADVNALKTGSTLGPYISSSGVPTVDLGIPLLGMHSIRETVHQDDIKHLTTILEKALEI